MSIDKFTLLMEKQERCPESLPSSLQALWYDKRDWDKADRMVRNASDFNIAWLPAYLHRREGNLSNTRYWYKRSGRPEFKVDLNQEWSRLLGICLGRFRARLAKLTMHCWASD